MLPLIGKNAISPFLNSFLGRSIPEFIGVSKYAMLFPSKCAFPSSGQDLIIIPTVLGDKCLFSSQEILVFPRISKIKLILETELVLNSMF